MQGGELFPSTSSTSHWPFNQQSQPLTQLGLGTCCPFPELRSPNTHRGKTASYLEWRLPGCLCARCCARPPHASRPQAAPRATCPARGPRREPQAGPGRSARGELFKVQGPGPPQTSCIRSVPYPLPPGKRSHLSRVRGRACSTARARQRVVSCFLTCAPTMRLALYPLLEEPGVVQPLSLGNTQQLRESGPHTGAEGRWNPRNCKESAQDGPFPAGPGPLPILLCRNLFLKGHRTNIF